MENEVFLSKILLSTKIYDNTVTVLTSSIINRSYRPYFCGDSDKTMTGGALVVSSSAASALAES